MELRAHRFKVAVAPTRIMPPMNIVSISSTKVKPFLLAKDDVGIRVAMIKLKGTVVVVVEPVLGNQGYVLARMRRSSVVIPSHEQSHESLGCRSSRDDSREVVALRISIGEGALRVVFGFRIQFRDLRPIQGAQILDLALQNLPCSRFVTSDFNEAVALVQSAKTASEDHQQHHGRNHQLDERESSGT